MHTEAQLRRAAANAGCRVLAIRRIQTAVGPALCARFEGRDNEAAFRLLLEFALDDVGDPAARTVGLQIRDQFGPEQVRVARAIHAWVKKRIAYVPEPSETFQAPWYTIAVSAGDCDDHANLVNAIAHNAGLKARIVPVRNQRGDISHACAQVLVDGVWTWAETTLDAELDEPPRAAALRLKPAGREDIASSSVPNIGDSSGGTVVLQGPVIPLRRGVRYRARARVDSPRALTYAAGIRHFFEDLGFAGVSVFTDPDELPADWPSDQRDAIAGGGFGSWTVYLEGSWGLVDQGLPRPEQLLAVWESDQDRSGRVGGPGVVTLPEIVIVGDVPRAFPRRVGSFVLVGTIAAGVLLALRWLR